MSPGQNRVKKVKTVQKFEEEEKTWVISPPPWQPRQNRVKKSKDSLRLPRKLKFDMQAHLNQT